VRNTLGQLLDLRRARERRAETDLSRAVAEHRRQAEHIAELERQREDLAVASGRRVAELYMGVVDNRLGPAGLDSLVASVDEQYRLRQEMKVRIATQQRLLGSLAEDVEKARAALNARRRHVVKLESVATEIDHAIARKAEILAELEMERPFIPKTGTSDG